MYRRASPKSCDQQVEEERLPVLSRANLQARLLPEMSLGTVFLSHQKAETPEVKRSVTLYEKAQDILDIADSYTALPESKIFSTLRDSIKHAGDGVSDTFFGKETKKAIWGEVDCTTDRDELAVVLMSVSLTKVSNYDFNKTTFGSTAKHHWKALINSGKGSKMGRALLVEDLVKHHGFQKFLDNKEKTSHILEDILSDKVYIVGTVVKQLVSENNLPAKMKLFFLKLLGSKKFDDVVNAWRENASEDLVKPVVDFAASVNHLKFCIGDLEADPFVGTVTSQCGNSKTHTWNETRYVANPWGGGGGTVKVPHTDVIFGGPVRDWLDSTNGPKKFGLRTGKDPRNMKEVKAKKSKLGCFLGGTEVLLQNGSSVPIDSLTEHMNIVTAHGQIGTISSEMVEIKCEQETVLYGFNDVSPFFLASHPFWTQHGWKAMDPQGAKDENDWLEVGQLSEGDFVYHVNEYDEKHQKVEYEWVEIKKIPFKTFAEGTMMYGVHLREGPRSYHANGYLVAVNYPEITMERMTEGMHKLSTVEKKKVHDHFKAMKPYLDKILGPGAEHVANLGEKHLERVLSPKESKHCAPISLKEVIIPSMKLKHKPGIKPFHGQRFPQHVSLVKGYLFLDGDKDPVETHFTDENKISWTRRYRNRWEHGTLHLYADRLQGHGVVSLTRARDHKKALISSTFVAAANENKYTCYISKNPFVKDTDSTKDWNSFGELVMGIDCSGETCKQIGEIQILPTMEKPDSLENHVTFSVGTDRRLNVTVFVPNEYKSLLGYTKLSGTFSWDYTAFKGTAIKYDALKPGFEGDHFAWKGYVRTNVKTDAMHAKARKIAMDSVVHKSANHLLSTPVTNQENATLLRRATVAPMAMTTAIDTDSVLTLEHLFTILPPDSHAVHDMTFSLIQKCMKYKMDASDRENILGQRIPNDLPGSLIAVADEYHEFFGNRFANAYLMNGLSQSDHFNDKITQEERDQLLYYWAGSDPDCLANDKDYTEVNNKVCRIAYLELLPDLQRYLDDGGQSWAQQLYDKLISPEVLTGLALSEEIMESTSLIQKQSMVLYALHPDGNFGTQFYEKIMATRLNENSSYFQGNSQDEERMTEFVGDYLKQLIMQILSGSDVITSEISQQLNQELHDMATELGIAISKDNEVTTNAIINGIGMLVSETMNFFNSQSGPLWNKFTSGMSEWIKKNPLKAKTAKFFSSTMCMVFWGMSLVYTITTFMNWKTLKPEEKVSLIANTIAFTFTSISRIPDFLKGVQAACVKGKAPFKMLRDWIKARRNKAVGNGVQMETNNLAQPLTAEEGMGRSAAEAGADVAQTTTRWSRFFAITEAIARITTVLALGAAAVAIGFQIARDFKNGASVGQKTLDILQGVCIGVSFVAAAAGLFVESVMIPVIGIACAIVGLVLALVDIFMHREKPKPKPLPADVYVDGPGKTFVSGLSKPTQQWIDDYHKHHVSDDTNSSSNAT